MADTFFPQFNEFSKVPIFKPGGAFSTEAGGYNSSPSLQTGKLVNRTHYNHEQIRGLKNSKQNFSPILSEIAALAPIPSSFIGFDNEGNISLFNSTTGNTDFNTGTTVKVVVLSETAPKGKNVGMDEFIPPNRKWYRRRLNVINGMEAGQFTDKDTGIRVETSTQSVWNFPVNRTVDQPGSILHIPPGTYIIIGFIPALNVDSHQSRLYSLTQNAEWRGSSVLKTSFDYLNAHQSFCVYSILIAYLTVGLGKEETISIEHQIHTSAASSDIMTGIALDGVGGSGVEFNSTNEGENTPEPVSLNGKNMNNTEVFTQVIIIKT